MLFKNIIGQKEAKQRLIQSVKEGIIPHARLFYGNTGSGVLPLALAYARYLHCTDRQEDDACGKCKNCLQINKLSHPDLHFVFPIFNKKTTGSICDEFLPQWREFLLKTPYANLSSWLDFIAAENKQGSIYSREANEILRKLNLKAYESDFKIMLVWLPEKMETETANKLLKLLEEPPEKTVFLLVSEEPDKIIGTIQSRSQNFPIPPIAKEDLKAAIVAQGLTDEDAETVAHLAAGSYTDAMHLIHTADDSEYFLDFFISIMRNAWRHDLVNFKENSEEFAKWGRDKQKTFLAFAQKMIRENFLYQLQLPEINYLNRKEKEFSANFSPYVNERNVLDFMEELALAERHIEQNANPKMVFFDLSLKIAVMLNKK